jgi:AraC-like DNA-binding protein
MVTRPAARAGPNPPDSPQGIRSFVFRTADPDHFAEQIAPVAPGVRTEAADTGDFAVKVRAWRLPRAGIVSIDMGHGRNRFADERDFFVLTAPLAGKTEVRSGHREDEIVPGEVHLSPPYEPFDCNHFPRAPFLGLRLDAGLLRSHARALDEGGRGRARSSSCVVSSGARCASFRHYLHWLSRELQREGSTLAAPQVAWETEDLLVAMLAEACWPPDAARGAANRDALRRAEEFLAAHMRTAVSLPEVAAVAGVSLRTLTRAFHKKHGIGPIGFLRQRRLHAARRDFLSAPPGSESVTHVALRYGFAHLGRFASEYRKAFGEYPSETLCR